MAAVNRGFGSSLGVGQEATWGTAVARSVWLRNATVGLMRKRTKEVVPHLGDLSQASTNPRHFFVASDFVEGPVSIPMAYDDATLMLTRNLLGTNTEGGAGPFTHTQTLSSPPPVGMTLEAINGTPASGGGFMAEVFEGCLFTSGTISVESGKLMMLECNAIGETSQGLVAPGTPTYSTGGEYIRHNHAGVLTYNAITRPVKAMKVTIDRGLDRNHELGSLFTSLPVENRLSVDVEFTCNWQLSAWDTEYLADTQSSATVTFTSGAKSLGFTFHNLLVMDVSRPVQSAGAILQTIKCKAFADATNQGCTLVYTNANALYTAN